MSTHNMYSCQQCRTHHQVCKYVGIEDCERCVKFGYQCGLKVNAKQVTKPTDTSSIVPPVTPSPASTPSAPTPAPAAPAPVRARQVRHPKNRRGSGVTARRTSTANRAEFAASPFNKIGLVTNEEFTNTIDYIFGIVAFQILIVKTWFSFLRAKAAPRLHDQLAQSAESIDALITWLDNAFQPLLGCLSDEERRSIEFLTTIRASCRNALRRGPTPQSTGNTQPRFRAGSIDMSDMSVSWKEFRQRPSTSRDILACVIQILADLDNDSVRYRLTSDWSPEEMPQSYGRTSRIINLLYQDYLKSQPKLLINTTNPTMDIFPTWHIALRNGHKDFAYSEWMKQTEIHGDVNVFDIFGISLAHLAVEIEDVNRLRKMLARNFSIGHIRGNGPFILSPLEFASVIDSHDSYLALVKYRQIKDRNMQAEFECLVMATVAGALEVVSILTNDRSPLEGFPFPHTVIIEQAIIASRDDIALFLVELESRASWCPNVPHYVEYAELRQSWQLAWRLRNLRTEPISRNAFLEVGGQL